MQDVLFQAAALLLPSALPVPQRHQSTAAPVSSHALPPHALHFPSFRIAHYPPQAHAALGVHTHFTTIHRLCRRRQSLSQNLTADRAAAAVPPLRLLPAAHHTPPAPATMRRTRRGQHGAAVAHFGARRPVGASPTPGGGPFITHRAVWSVDVPSDFQTPPGPPPSFLSSHAAGTSLDARMCPPSYTVRAHFSRGSG